MAYGAGPAGPGIPPVQPPGPPVHQPPVHQPPVHQPPVHQSPVPQPPVQQSPVHQSPVLQAPVAGSAGVLVARYRRGVMQTRRRMIHVAIGIQCVCFVVVAMLAVWLASMAGWIGVLPLVAVLTFCVMQPFLLATTLAYLPKEGELGGVALVVGPEGLEIPWPMKGRREVVGLQWGDLDRVLVRKTYLVIRARQRPHGSRSNVVKVAYDSLDIPWPHISATLQRASGGRFG